MGKLSFTRRPGAAVDLVDPPEMDDLLLADDVHAPQYSESAELGAFQGFAVANERPRGPVPRIGPQPNEADESHHARLVQRAQAALAEEQQAARGTRR